MHASGSLPPAISEERPKPVAAAIKVLASILATLAAMIGSICAFLHCKHNQDSSKKVSKPSTATSPEKKAGWAAKPSGPTADNARPLARSNSAASPNIHVHAPTTVNANVVVNLALLPGMQSVSLSSHNSPSVETASVAVRREATSTGTGDKWLPATTESSKSDAVDLFASEKAAAACTLSAIRDTGGPSPAYAAQQDSCLPSPTTKQSTVRDDGEDSGSDSDSEAFSLFPHALHTLSLPSLPTHSPVWSLRHGVDGKGRHAPGSWTLSGNALWKHDGPGAGSHATHASTDEHDDPACSNAHVGGEGRVWHGDWARVQAEGQRRAGGSMAITASALIRKKRAQAIRDIRDGRRVARVRPARASSPTPAPPVNTPAPARAPAPLPHVDRNPPIIVRMASSKGGREGGSSEIVLQRELQCDSPLACVRSEEADTTSTAAAATPSPGEHARLPAQVVVGCSGMKRQCMDEQPPLPPAPVPASSLPPTLLKYSTMLRVGVPAHAVRAKMAGEGCKEEEIEMVLLQRVADSKPQPPSVSKPLPPMSPEASSGVPPTALHQPQGPPRPAALSLPQPPRPATSGGPPRPPGAAAVSGPPRPPGASPVSQPMHTQAMAQGAGMAGAPGGSPMKEQGPAVELDTEVAKGLMSLFAKPESSSSAVRPKSLPALALTPGTPSPSPLGSGSPVVQRVALIDPRRGQNVAIALAKLKSITPSSLLSSLQSLVPMVRPTSPAHALPMPLTLPQATILLDVCPAVEELQSIRAWAESKGSGEDVHALAKTSLPEAERFYLHLTPLVGSVGGPLERARALAFRVGWTARKEEMDTRMRTARACLVEISGKREALTSLLACATTACNNAGPGAWASVLGAGQVGANKVLAVTHLPSLRTTRLPSLPARDTRGTVMHYLAALADMTQPGTCDALVGGMQVQAGSAGGRWGQAGVSKSSPLPSVSNVWPCCTSLCAVKEECLSLGHDLASLQAEVNRYSRLAGLPTPLPALPAGVQPSIGPQASPIQAVTAISVQLQELQGVYSTLQGEGRACMAGLCADGTPLPTLAQAILDTCTALGRARVDMKAMTKA